MYTAAAACVVIFVRQMSAAMDGGGLVILNLIVAFVVSAAGGATLGFVTVFAVGASAALLRYPLSKVLHWFLLTFGNDEQRAAAQFRKAIESYSIRLRDYEHWMLRQSERFWSSLSGLQFEQEVGSLFKSMGYQVQFTPVTGDGGVDLILRRGADVTVVQCKSHASKVGIATARELVASRSDFKATSAILVAASGVTGPTRDYCRRHGIQVLDSLDLAKAQKALG